MKAKIAGQGTARKAAPDLKAGKRLAELMLRCGLSGAELARRVDVHENTIRNWRSGTTCIPGAVFAYLELLAAMRDAVR